MERNTKQRDAIRQVFMDVPRPLGPFEILEEAKQHVSGIGIATVYRTINALVEAGWLSVVELPGESPRYERAGRGHHHHFSCRQCSRVFELVGCAGDFKKLTPRGFKLESHEIVLYGRCNMCAAA
ncbi:MAG: transcriptional repressor [Gemmatimonadaceae bacterium]|jgi:Fur family ferric uptake transcriptional regulator|nr:transcriptional repressor [Gemmatimonadaceae bacterium]MCC6430141.1 transcriptional repressor [Gemmatimonadaceae bacterium]